MGSFMGRVIVWLRLRMYHCFLLFSLPHRLGFSFFLKIFEGKMGYVCVMKAN
jgi:hypothetical protein